MDHLDILRQTLKVKLEKLNLKSRFEERLAWKKRSAEIAEGARKLLKVEQDKFDASLKQKENMEEGIYNCTLKMNELWKEIQDAEEEYNKQDPADRDRSFSIAY